MSQGPWKPSGYASCAPYLVVYRAQEVIDFAKATFGATELRRYDLPDGSIMHAEFRIDDTVIMIGDASDMLIRALAYAASSGLPEQSAPMPQGLGSPKIAASATVTMFPPIPSLVHVYVDDVDRVYAAALSAGATAVEPPSTRPGDPDRRGSVKDPCGNTWAIATQA